MVQSLLRLKKRIRWEMIRTHHFVGFRPLYGRLARIGQTRVTRTLLKEKGVQAVFLRHSHATHPDFVLGHSDLDLTLILTPEAGSDPKFVRKMNATLQQLSRLYPFVNPEDARFITEEELDRLTRANPSPVEFLYQPNDWSLAGGETSELEAPGDLVGTQASWHPEFHKWWFQRLPMNTLNSKVGHDLRYLRPHFRGALKNRLHLLQASSNNKSQGTPKEDHLPENPGGDDELLCLLQEIKDRHFWVSHPQETRDKILFLAQRDAQKFASTNQSVGVEFSTEYPIATNHDDPDLRESRFEAIKKTLDALKILKRFAVSAVAYPVPLSVHNRYLVHFLLPDDLDFESSRQVYSTFREDLAGEKGRVKDLDVSYSLAPESAFSHSSFLLGQNTPFLREHIHRFGQALWGTAPSFEGSLSRDDLATWIRIHFPYEYFNYRRRIDHAVRNENFILLGALLTFLEKAEIVTDPLLATDGLLDLLPPDRTLIKDLPRIFSDPWTRISTEENQALFLLQNEAYKRLDSHLAPPSHLPVQLSPQKLEPV